MIEKLLKGETMKPVLYAIPVMFSAMAVSFSYMGFDRVSAAPTSGAAAPRSNIAQNVSASKDESTFTKAMNAAGLVETLSGLGPFTVFAPSDAAFAKLPEGVIETLLMPVNQKLLGDVLRYHIVAGQMDARSIADAIRAGNGSITLKTLRGEAITLRLADGMLQITDGKGGLSTVIMADQFGSNGIVHTIDAVLRY